MPKGMSRSKNKSGGMPGGKEQPKISFSTAKRLFGMVFKKNKLKLALVVICIIISSVVNVSGFVFIQTIID